MKVALTIPAHVGIVEKVAALFSHVDLLIVDEEQEAKRAGNKKRIANESVNHGYTLSWMNIDDADLAAYDCLIDTWETRHWAPSWREKSLTVECPRVLSISWFRPDIIPMSAEEITMARRSAVLVDSQTHAEQWRTKMGFDVSHAYWYPGDHWFDQTWTGEDKRVLYILAGAYKWRGGLTSSGLTRFRLWHELIESVPGYHIDAAERYRTAMELAQEVATFRCHTNLDAATSSRHLALAYTECMAAGVPSLAIDIPEHDYSRVIRECGMVCEDMADLTNKARLLLEDDALAAEVSAATKAAAHKYFSRDALMPVWESAIDEAKRKH